MSEALVDALLGAPGVSFPGSVKRLAVLLRVRELSSQEARAFYVAALAHADLPWYTKREIALELEWWRFGDLAPALVALGDEVPGLALQIEALGALVGGGGCVCEVYVRRRAEQPSPLMEKGAALSTDHPQTEERAYRCTVCAAALVHRQEHHERGATVHTWRRTPERGSEDG